MQPLQDLPAELVVRRYRVHTASLPKPGVYAMVYRRYLFHLMALFPKLHRALVFLLAPLQVVKDV
jgi:hypothetical protein